MSIIINTKLTDEKIDTMADLSAQEKLIVKGKRRIINQIQGDSIELKPNTLK